MSDTTPRNDAGEPMRKPEPGIRDPRLAATWAALELPPASPTPPGFTDRVMARVRERAAGRETIGSGAPGWLPAACAAALAAGVLAGAGLGVMGPAAVVVGGERSPVTVEAAVAEPPASAGRPAGAAATPEAAEADELAADLAEDLPAGLDPDSTLTGGYWAAIGLADDLVAYEAVEEPWS